MYILPRNPYLAPIAKSERLLLLPSQAAKKKKRIVMNPHNVLKMLF